LIAKRLVLKIILSFSLSIAFFVYAIFSAFRTLSPTSLVFWRTLGYTSIGGFGALILGYLFVILLGGRFSLQLTEFIAHLNNSRHVIEVVDDDSRPTGNVITRYALFLIPCLIFFTLVTLAWDIHTIQPGTITDLQAVLQIFDVFSKPLSANSVTYSIEIIPIMILLLAIAGFIPAMVLPYFRKFKVTGVNGGPFQLDLLFTIVGAFTGVSVILTLMGFLFNTLWMGQGPHYYHFVVPAMIGLSIDFSIGAFMGRNRAEKMVKNMLEKGVGERIFLGTVVVHGKEHRDHLPD
jgi:hypothetical protein